MGPLAAVVLLALAAPALSGCVGLAVGAGAAGGVAVAEERTLGDQVDDFTIGLAVGEGLFAHDERLFLDVSVDVTEGRVLLAGKVPAAADRVDAVRIAWQAEGVVEVINELQVDDTGDIGEYLTDVRISTELRAALLFDSRISSINFNVETVGGVVYITGVALTQAELDRAIDHARTISGVRKVVSHVRVKDA